MKNYDRNEMCIRETKKGGFQVLPEPYTSGDMCRAPVFGTQGEAEEFIRRPMPEWIARMRAEDTARIPYEKKYADVLSRPELREMRQTIQTHYRELMELDKLCGAYQRASVYSIGQVSCLGRNISEVYQKSSDEMAEQVDEALKNWQIATREYEIVVQKMMDDAGIPVSLFRHPINQK